MSIEVTRKERLTKKELNKLWNNYMWFYNGCTNFENFYGNGWAYTLKPLFKKFYNKEGQIDAMKNHIDWYNNEAQTGALLYGMVVGLEEERAIEGNVSQEVIRTTKASLMGPIAGIGDSVIQGTLIPVLLSIAITLCDSGGIVGPLFYILSYLAIIVGGSYIIFHKGYQLGRSAINVLTGDKVNRIVEAFSLFGIIVVGALGAQYVKASTALQWATSEESVTTLQSVIDGIFPKLLSLILIFICYYFVKKKNINIIKLVLGLLVVVVLFGFIGIV